MASKGPKSTKPAPAAAKSKLTGSKQAGSKQTGAKAPVVSKTPAEPSKAVAAPVVEKKQPVINTPVAAKPAMPVEPAPAREAEPVAAVASAADPSPVESGEVVPIAVAAVESAEKVAEEVAPVVEVAKVAAETVEQAITTPAPPAVEPAPVFKKEFRMNVDPKMLFTDFNDRAKAAMEKSAKSVEEFNDFAKGNVEALVESSKITAKGLEALSQEAAEYSRKSFETATAALKSMAAAKSPTDFFKLQSDFFRGAFDSYVAEASKTTEAVLKLAGEAAQPLSSRVALAADKAKVAA